MHINNDFQRNSNISHVFGTVWNNSEISRIDIARKLELYRSTVSNIIGTLLENDVICEGERGSVTEKGGRKPVFLSINKKFGCIIGIELQTNIFTVEALTFDGKEIFSMEGETPLNESLINSPEKSFLFIVDHIIEKIIPEIEKLPVPPLGICIGVPGIVDIDKGIIIRSDPFSLKSFKYAEALGKRYGLPLFMENDAKCCAWLQCALHNDVGKRDFLCVLAKDYQENERLDYPGNFRNGIGVGLSISMNGRVMHGHNYAIGEYISRTWSKNKKGQTGLPEAVLNTIVTSEDSYREWLIDLFSTLTMFVPLLEPKAIFMHGQPASRKSMITDVIHKEIPQFEDVVERCGSEFIIMDENPYEIARGAALMFLQKMFEIPDLEGSVSYSHISWDDLFSLQRKSRNKLFHRGC
jgi:hypothetical protein